MVGMAKVVKVIPSLALGIGAMCFLPSYYDLYSDFSSSCPHATPHFLRIGHSGIDGFMCSLLLVYKSCMESMEGWISLVYLLPLYMSCFTFMSVEASRSDASWLLSWTPVYALVIQAVGISVIFPLLWLPIYLLQGRPRRGEWGKRISLSRVMAIAGGMLLLGFVTLGMFSPFGDNQTRQFFVFAFQFAPALVSLAWVLHGGGAPPSGKKPWSGHKAVIALHLVLSGSGIFCHLLVTLTTLHNPDLPSRMMGLLINSPNNHHRWGYFMLVDLLVIFLCLLYLVSLEDGLAMALAVLSGTALIGPAAAFSFYFVSREQRIIGAASLATSSKSN